VLAAMDAGVCGFSYCDSHDVDRQFDYDLLEYGLGRLATTAE
jgi:hypothetical protein